MPPCVRHLAHELLTYLVLEHDVLLHGSNDTGLEMLEPRPAHDFGTELHAVVASDDGIWPVFYAVVSRRRVEGVFTACMHMGKRSRLRRFYMFVVFASTPEIRPPGRAAPCTAYLAQRSGKNGATSGSAPSPYVRLCESSSARTTSPSPMLCSSSLPPMPGGS